MPVRLRPAFGLAVAAIALSCSGCGGAGKASSTGTSTTGATSASASRVPATSAHSPSSTKAQFVAQAQAICRALGAQEKPLKAREEAIKGEPATTMATDFVSLVRQAVAISRSTERKLQALAQPAADAHAIAALLNAFAEETIDANGIAKAANLQESTLGELAAKRLQQSIAKNSALAREYGMGDCVGAE